MFYQNIFKIIGSLLLVVSLSLNSFGQDKKISKLDLVGCWTDSREETILGSGKNIYRPCDFKTFPPSMYRFKMVLNANSKCSWLYLAPNDAHHMVNGTWTFDKKKNLIEISNPKGKSVRKIYVLDVDKNIMIVK